MFSSLGPARLLRLRPFSKTGPMFKFRPLQFRPFQRQFSSPPPKPTGIKALMKEYGYSALGVYLFLSALDLPFCYILVHSMGREQIEQYENKAKQWFGYGKSDAELEKMQQINRIEEEHEEHQEPGLFSWFSWTEFAIAYGIHKSVFIFFRVPATAALTPSIVKLLRNWGFKIGTDKLATTASLAKETVANAANPKFGSRPNRKQKWFWFF